MFFNHIIFLRNINICTRNLNRKIHIYLLNLSYENKKIMKEPGWQKEDVFPSMLLTKFLFIEKFLKGGTRFPM